MPTLPAMPFRTSPAMHTFDNALKPDMPQPRRSVPPSVDDATRRTGAALAVARAHFIARGWRPLAIQPTALLKSCDDVSMLLLMNDAGHTAWLSTRDWSALANPVDAFRREMVCVRAARVDETILLYDGDFPDNVVEAAAYEPSLRLIDAAALGAMSTVASPPLAVMAPTRRQRLTRPAQQAAHYVQDKFAYRLRRLNGERRRLKTLSTVLLILVGASLGFLAFNMVVMMSESDADDTTSQTVQADPKPLPQPMPPSQGYVAQAAGVSGMAARGASIAPSRLDTSPKPILLVATASPSGSMTPSQAIAENATQGYEDVEQTQRRADAAMRVIEGTTQEVRPVATSALTQNAVVPNAASSVPPIGMPLVRSVDPAMADSESSLRDPAIID
jgi:hypothetical protein